MHYLKKTSVEIRFQQYVFGNYMNGDMQYPPTFAAYLLLVKQPYRN